jgi:hypothetical protein
MQSALRFSPQLRLLVCCLKNVKNRIHKPIILHVILYGFETWSLTLRREHGLRVLENRVLRRIFLDQRETSEKRFGKTAR